MNKEILDVLYQERSRLLQKYSAPGWNLWAIVGSIAGLIWILIDLYKVGYPIYREVFSLFIISLVCFYASIALGSLVFGSSNANKKSRLYLGKNLATIRVNVILHSLLFIGLTYANLHFQFLQGPFFVVFKYAVIVIVLFNIAILWVSFTEIPISTANNGKKFRFISLGLITITLLVGGIVVTGLLANFRETNFIPSIKFALVIFAIYYSTLLLIQTLKPNDLLDKIDNLIEKSLFDQTLSTEEILSELKVLVLGLELQVILEKPILNYLNSLDSFDRQCDLVNKKIRNLDSVLMKDSDDTQKEEEVRDSLAILRINHGSLSQKLDDVKKAGNTFNKKIFILKSQDIENLDQFERRIAERLSLSGKKHSKMSDDFNELLDRVLIWNKKRKS